MEEKSRIMLAWMRGFFGISYGEKQHRGAA